MLDVRSIFAAAIALTTAAFLAFPSVRGSGREATMSLAQDARAHAPPPTAAYDPVNRPALPGASPAPETRGPGADAAATQPPPEVPQPSPVAAPQPAPQPAADQAPPPTPAAAPSPLSGQHMVVYYGTPLTPHLGILGTMSPEDAAASVAEQARRYDELNGDLGAVGALDLIYSMAQAEPAEDGLYIRRLPDHEVQRYIDVARDSQVMLFLDLQIGRAGVLDEVRNVERYLLEPNVHLALDPEYAVGPEGVPIATPGSIGADSINEVQAYLDGLSRDHGLPPKVLVIHQYMQETVVDSDRVSEWPGVDLVLNMDAFGEVHAKRERYEFFSAMPWSRYDALTVFLRHDDAIMSEEDILGLSPQPRVIFYQ